MNIDRRRTLAESSKLFECKFSFCPIRLNVSSRQFPNEIRQYLYFQEAVAQVHVLDLSSTTLRFLSKKRLDFSQVLDFLFVAREGETTSRNDRGKSQKN